MDVPALISALDDHGFEYVTTTRKVEAIQDAIRVIEAARPWPFLETSTNLNFDGSSDIPSNMPGNFRAALRAKDLVTGRRVLPIRLDDLEDQIGTDYGRVDDPRLYYFEGNNLKFWPIPPASTARVKLRHLSFSADITSTSAESAIIVPARHHPAILFGALSRISAMEDDPEMSTLWATRRDERMAVMIEDVVRKQYDQPDFVRVIDADDWDYDLL